MSLIVLSRSDVDAAFFSFHPNEIEIILAQTLINISTSSDIYSPPPTTIISPYQNLSSPGTSNVLGSSRSHQRNRKAPVIWPYRMTTFGSACRVVVPLGSTEGTIQRSPQDRFTTLLFGDNEGEPLHAIVNTRRLTAFRIAAGGCLSPICVNPHFIRRNSVRVGDTCTESHRRPQGARRHRD